MTKLLFAPFSILAGLLAGLLGRKAFDFAWGQIDEEEPPEPTHRRSPMVKVVIASALQGAIFSGTRTAVDRGMRRGFFNLTGLWPGEESPDRE